MITRSHKMKIDSTELNNNDIKKALKEAFKGKKVFNYTNLIRFDPVFYLRCGGGGGGGVVIFVVKNFKNSNIVNDLTTLYKHGKEAKVLVFYKKHMVIIKKRPMSKDKLIADLGKLVFPK